MLYGECMLVTRVVHCKKEKYDIYCGRPSDWENPFVIGKDGTRKQVIEKFKQYMDCRYDLIVRLHELKGKILGCWCSPQSCHADYLAFLANTLTDCDKCNGCCWYQYSTHGTPHYKICEQCCNHDQGFHLLEIHYGKDNGKYCCIKGCGFKKDTPC